MKKTIHFISGLPRSGSTLLCNLLLQNPRFYATGTSPLLEMFIQCRNHLDAISDFRAMPEALRAARKLNTMRGVLTHFYDDVERDIVFDKNRSWPYYIESAEAVMERKVKIVATVRDLRDVLASFEQLWRKNKSTMAISQEAASVFEFQTVSQRCDFWLRNNQTVGLAYNQISDAFARGFGSRIKFVEFDTLTQTPGKAMREIYDFLEEPEFKHDFDNVEQIVQEDDYAHSFPGLHKIRNKVEPVKSQWMEVIGKDVGMRYAPFARFWRDLG